MLVVAAMAAAEDVPVSGVLFAWPSDMPAEGGTPGRDEALASDRPDFVEASCTVGAGTVQIETGYTLLYDDDGGSRVLEHSFPEVLVRLGLVKDWLELRVGWSAVVETTTVDGTSDTDGGSRDVYLGVKLGLTPQQGWLPETALVPQMTVSVGGPFSDDRVLPGVNFLYGWEVTDRVSAAGSTQMSRRVDDGSRHDYAELAQAMTVGVGLTDMLGAYAEWFMFAPIGAGTARTEHYLDGGLTIRVTNDLQLDVRAGKGLTNPSVDVFGGVGAAARF